MKRFTLFVLKIAFLFSWIETVAIAEGTEERFQDVFITAGYATAFGAALGAASLSFYDHPEEHMKDVAIGASLGFIGGTLLGTYVVLAPVMVQENFGSSNLVAENRPQNRLRILPAIDTAGNLRGGALGFSIATP